ncbi:pyridoxamine 5'-phosphate oxidase-domain-containing protein [Biscogniauxia mediterranea]|nr:pyridoxamine 5'-phosphate oxidase-domain-containing protein [Biscogniauxia mediterranea]
MTTDYSAPWRAPFLEHIATMPTPEFVLSTVRRIPPSSSSPGGSHAYAPRARTCVFRGLWAELPANPQNEGPLNPRGAYASDLPTFTTDARMDKAEELWGGGGEGEEEGEGVGEGEGEGEREREKKKKKKTGSGGGAPVEAVWWAPGPKTQWRVRGAAYLLAADDVEGSRAEAIVRARMRRLTSSSSSPAPPSSSASRETGEGGGEQEGGTKTWSFAREVAAHFANLSPAMRGSFRNPPPGRPVDDDAPVGDGRLGLGLGQKITGPLARDPIARENFRVVVVLPDEVDRCDLSDPERPRRWVYRRVGGGGGGGEEEEEGEGTWEVVEVWP